ncbi:hypothetical protein HBI23_254050 [Parastagonospora nodorum]|nr:hypothetical protein HBI23_254050 [Parastagonospora nodorum]KAH5621665.1 hypothetical protein HBI51_249650 [Parastagonospora nodorum]KAH5983388.1 hypothetical protein HBI84_247900 [Parastagonospora nodorum]KAH6133482.1 hypothetical protein HBI68_253840 [Parastagonospora nodorum]KAH6380468.1 hypothetical protein HBI08_238340 [Parastagonospora nodorum]
MNLSERVPFLLRLPAELQSEIYGYVLSHQIFSILCWRRYTPFGFATRIIQKRKHFLALLRVSRQVYSETRWLPFTLNTFQFESQDAFHSWFDKFSVEKSVLIRNVRLVTWMARHMTEGQGWRLSPLHLVFPIDRLPGLRKLSVEVRGNGRVKDCLLDGCCACEEHGDKVAVEEEKFRTWVAEAVGKVEIRFQRTAA